MSQDRKEFSKELLIKARDESFMESGIYSPISSMTAPEDKERLEAFHNFFNERFKKMFAPLMDENVRVTVPHDFLDKFTFCYWDTDEANACCWPRELPDGRIIVAVTKGMIELCETEGELMGIVGHEVGHYIHRLIKPYDNNEAEEQGSDIISMMHMPNAGYHPREMISIFEKMERKYGRKQKTLENIALSSIFDPHPDMELRNNINKLYVQIDDHRYAHLTETPLNKTCLTLDGLAPMDRGLRDDLMESVLSGSKTFKEDFVGLLSNIEALQVPIVSREKLDDFYLENIWKRILSDYFKGKENTREIDLENDENKDQVHHTDILNHIYWNKLKKLSNGLNQHELLATLWDKLKQIDGNGRQSDLYKLECSMLHNFLSAGHTKFDKYLRVKENNDTEEYEVIADNLAAYFQNEAQREVFLPSEIVQARQYIKELLENPEKISLDIIPTEALDSYSNQQLSEYKEKIVSELQENKDKNEQLRDLIGRLGKMVDSGYLSFANAGYLLNPIVEVQEGQPHPLYSVTHTPSKYTSEDWSEGEFLERMNPVKRLLSTLGYYDSQAFELGPNVYNLLNPNMMGNSYAGLNQKDIQNMDECSVFIIRNVDSCLKCEYNNKTGQITSYEPMDLSISTEELVGQKCLNIQTFENDGDSYVTFNALMKYSVKKHHDKLYKLKTLALNTQMHYKLEDMLKSFGESDLRGEQVFDIVDFSQTYIKDFYEKYRTLNFKPGVPFVLEGMNWPYDVKTGTRLQPQLVGRDENEDNETNHRLLFDFLDKDNVEDTYLNLAKGYIQLLERGLEDPQVAEQVIEASFYAKRGDGELVPIRTNPVLFVLQPDIAFKWNHHMRWNEYVETHLQRRIFSILNKSPYVDQINEYVYFESKGRYDKTNYSKVEEGNNERLLKDMYEMAPNMCARLYALYEEDEHGNRTYVNLPVKTFADMKKMADLYVKNYWNKSTHQPKRFPEFLKIVHDKYLEEGHTDVPISFLADVHNQAFEDPSSQHYSYRLSSPLKSDSIKENDINLVHGYFENISNIDNWPAATQQSIRLMAKICDLSQDAFGKYNLSDIAPQSIIQDYYNKICSAPTFEAKLSVLSWAVAKRSKYDTEKWNLSKTTTQQLLDIAGEKTIWDNSLDDNIKMYLWLNDRHAFNDNLALQIKTADYLITQLEQAPIEKQEEYSFLLLGKRADIPSPVNKQRLMNMWVKSVAQLVGSKDDMSDEYLKKVQPYIHKLHNKRRETLAKTKPERRTYSEQLISSREEHEPKRGRSKLISDYTYTALVPDMKKELTKMLQEALVSQPKLSAILSPEEHIGVASNKNAVDLGGKFINVLSQMTLPSDAEAMINFLLETPTRESVKRWSDMLRSGAISRYADLDGREISYDWSKNFHDEFWAKDFVVRLASLTELFNRAYPDEYDVPESELASQKRIENMLNRILAPDIENRDAFYAALYNYATAVDAKEIYKADSLLAGCLASAPKDPDNQMNLGETIRKFLESQGAAGIKVGQFLSAHEDIPAEVRSELKKLTNHASTPSRHDVFEIIREKHPELMHLIMQNGGLGKCLGAASHYLTYEMGEHVVSVSRPESATKASIVYNRLLTAIDKTLKEQPQNAHLLYVIRDAVTQAHSMNDIELNANIGYEQSILATRLYDNVEMKIDGHTFTFKTMPWIKPDEKTGPYHVKLQDSSGYEYSQSFKIMEKAGGIDYDKIQDPSYKKAVAKANFLLNLRMILKGDVFDDDRHTGQLKVEQISDNSTRINLFDTGSMSTEPPTKEELNSFGQALHATSRAIMALKSNATEEQKMATLRRVFPSATRFDNLFDGQGNASESALTICFNLAVNELRDKEGYAPLYISKVERSLANLSHFSNDIPNEEILPLVSNLVQKSGNIHPEIINGMGKEHFVLDHLIMQKILPNGKFNTDFIEKTIQSDGMHFISLSDVDISYNRSEETETTTGSVQHEKEDIAIFGEKTNIEFKLSQEQNNVTEQNISMNTEEKYTSLEFDTVRIGLDELLRPSGIDTQADKKAYDEALVDMCFPPENISLIDHMNDTLNRMPNSKIRKKLAKKMFNVVHNAAKKLQNGTQADAITKEICGYLKKTGIPNHLANKMAKRLPFKKAVALRLAFLRGGKLTFGSEAVMQVLGQNITKVAQAWGVFDMQKRQALISDNHMIVREAMNISNSDLLSNLLTDEKKEIGSNSSMNVMREVYSREVRKIRNERAMIRKNQDNKALQQTETRVEEVSMPEPQVKTSGKISNLLNKLSYLRRENGAVLSASAFKRKNLDNIRRRKESVGK